MTVGQDSGLSRSESREMDAIRGAEDLADLASCTAARSERQAYLDAKRRWRRLRRKELTASTRRVLPGDQISVDNCEFVIHGITHADTDSERSLLRDCVDSWLAEGDTVYCEQGIRSMYFEDRPTVYAMDDYQWASRQRRERGLAADGTGAIDGAFDGTSSDLDSLTAEARRLTFLIADAADDWWGSAISSALGSTASALLSSSEQQAVADDFASFRKSREAAAEPSKLGALQRYYKRSFLPQPLEREWLRRKDPGLELFTHARNERMADYATYHAEGGRTRLIVGAAHQPGIGYYLRAHRDGRRDLGSFEPLA